MTALEEGQLRYAGWRVVAASAVSHFFVCVLVYTFAVFFKPLASEFSWSRETVSSAYAAMALTAAVAAPLLGMLLDRLSVRVVLVPAMAIAGLAFASLSLLTPNVWQFHATWIFLGIAGTALSPVGFSRAVATWFQHRRGFALGLVIAGAAVAAVVQPPAAQYLIDTVGWRTAYVVIGAAMLAIGLPVVALFVRARPVHNDGPLALVEGATVADALRSRIFWTLVVVFFASALSLNGAIVHLAALLTDRGVSPEGAALVVSVMGAGSLAGRLSTGWLLDRLFGARVSFTLLSVAALGTYLLAGADSFASGAVAAALIGFGMGGELDVTPYLISRYFGLRSFSTLYGMAFGASAMAGAVGPVLLGRAFDTTGSYATLLPQIAAFMFVVSLLMLTLPRYDLRIAKQTAHDESGRREPSNR